MGSAECRRRLIVNADDFGRSRTINGAVINAHLEGILTSASLMVAGEAFAEAVELARSHPSLGVGLHLTLLCGRSVLSPNEIPLLANRTGQFTDSPLGAGMKYFFRRSLLDQLEREITAQVTKFRETGLVLDHINGHLNMHLHPIIFRILKRRAADWGLESMRLTRDPLGINVAIARGRWAYRVSHSVIFHLLSRWARPQLLRSQIRHTSAVFGLLQSGHVDEQYLLSLLPRLPPGDSELYSHPCLENFKAEFDALISPRVRRTVEDLRIELIRYQDL